MSAVLITLTWSCLRAERRGGGGQGRRARGGDESRGEDGGGAETRTISSEPRVAVYMHMHVHACIHAHAYASGGLEATYPEAHVCERKPCHLISAGRASSGACPVPLRRKMQAAFLRSRHQAKERAAREATVQATATATATCSTSERPESAIARASAALVQRISQRCSLNPSPHATNLSKMFSQP